jgi:acyl-CoA thioesterase YciA
MTFKKPVFIGDELSCYAAVEKVGQTSIAVRVESWVRRGISGEAVKVTEGLFTYVAIGGDRQPRVIGG